MARTVFQVGQDDPLAVPLLAELAVEYSSRYGRTVGQVHAELTGHPADAFAPPHGALLIVVEDGEPVAGGAFQRYDAETAELKRIWTSHAHRRRGLARFVLDRLEREARLRGYRRVYLTTGDRQPEAVALYAAAGYTPGEPFRVFHGGARYAHPFEKDLVGESLECAGAKGLIA